MYRREGGLDPRSGPRLSVPPPPSPRSSQTMCLLGKPWRPRRPVVAAAAPPASGAVSIFDEILRDRSLLLADRVGLACMFLTPLELKTFLAEESLRYERSGELEGALLLGISPRGMNMLEVGLVTDPAGWGAEGCSLLLSRAVSPGGSVWHHGWGGGRGGSWPWCARSGVLHETWYCVFGSGCFALLSSPSLSFPFVLFFSALLVPRFFFFTIGMVPVRFHLSSARFIPPP